MIVGTINIDKFLLCKNCNSSEELRAFSARLIPETFRECHQIRNNQLYLCCVTLRRIDEVSWDKKKEVINECINVKIFGYIDELIEINTLLSFCDFEMVKRYMEVL